MINDASQQSAAPPVRGKMRWYFEQQNLDTIVFVHGILGHYVNTWGLFPRLLHEDIDLPSVDILLWGYRTGLFSKHHSVETEGRHLATHLEFKILQGRDVFLVGHSMGGLIILKSLVDRMMDAKAQVHPCNSVQFITLYATPLGGAWKARFARNIWGWVFGLKRSLDKHLRAMSDGAFIQLLMTQVVNRIYAPRNEDGSSRRIPIRIIAATNDWAVDAQNRDAALSLYRDPSAAQLDEDHQSVKLPTSVGDERYSSLTRDLHGVFAKSFHALCKRAMDREATWMEREVAITDVLTRYGKIIRSRLCKYVEDDLKRSSLENDILTAIVNFGALQETPPFDAINRAVMTFARLNRLA